MMEVEYSLEYRGIFRAGSPRPSPEFQRSPVGLQEG